MGLQAQFTDPARGGVSCRDGVAGCVDRTLGVWFWAARPDGRAVRCRSWLLLPWHACASDRVALQIDLILQRLLDLLNLLVAKLISYPACNRELIKIREGHHRVRVAGLQTNTAVSAAAVGAIMRRDGVVNGGHHAIGKAALHVGNFPGVSGFGHGLGDDVVRLAGVSSEKEDWLPSGYCSSLPCVGGGADVDVAGIPADLTSSSRVSRRCRGFSRAHPDAISVDLKQCATTV